MWNELRYSVRSFAHSPLSTVALVLTIGLGVGGNAAVEGFVQRSVRHICQRDGIMRDK
jgi:hypothetical protein